MKKVIVLAGLLLTACAQLKHGDLQPVTVKSLKEQIYFTTCTGLVETWGTCHDKSREACKGDYKIIERFETPTGGGRRELTFQCKK